MNTPLFRFARRRVAFTLVEVIVSMGVLTLLVLMIAQLVSNAAAVTGMGTKHMDADGQARALLDRMSLDIGSMVRRADVDYYLKGRPAANSQQGGASNSINDQIAFYSEVSGYYDTSANNSSASQSPVSLIAYRLNSNTSRMERLSKGLVWNGGSSTTTPVVFLPIPLASPLPMPFPSPMPSVAPTPAWPQAADAALGDSDYEEFGPQVFRFEYYYILKGQNVNSTSSSAPASAPSIFSSTPWDNRKGIDHLSVNGLKDVAAIGVAIAVIDPKSQILVGSVQLKTLAGQMSDFADTMKPGDLEAQWQNAIDTSPLPKISAQGIHIYGRTFYLNSPSQ